MTTLPPLPEPAHEQVEDYSGIALNKVVVTPLFTTDQMRAYGEACAASEHARVLAWFDRALAYTGICWPGEVDILYEQIATWKAKP